MPTAPIADHRAGTTTKGPCTVAPNRYRPAAQKLNHVPGSQPPTSQPRARAAGSSSSRQPILRQQLDLRLQLLDALGQIVDQLALGIGQGAVFQVIARVINAGT